MRSCHEAMTADEGAGQASTLACNMQANFVVHFV